FHQLGLALERLQDEDATAIGQSQPRSRKWSLNVGFHLRSDLQHIGGALVYALVVVFVGGRPVHQVVGNFLPSESLGTEITHAVAGNLPLGGRLVGTILQDEALGVLLGCAD